MVEISRHFQGRRPSAIRQAQILFAERPDRDEVRVINLAIGNVSLPMHPAMDHRMRSLGEAGPFTGGVVKYTASVGLEETRQTFLHLIEASGLDASGLSCLVTDGGSAAMELVVLGTCGPGSERPLMLLDPAYANYPDMARRAAVPTISASRTLDEAGAFQLPDLDQIDELARRHRPAALVVIPADNPTGQHLKLEQLADLARLCVRHDIWLVSDEAYRQLSYGEEPPSSIWALGEPDVPGITGRRISIETASKVWNACGLRIGALVTDSPEFHSRAVAEATANLCANAIGQWIFAALGEESAEDLRAWYEDQRSYYRDMIEATTSGLRRSLPGLIVSSPEAALYSVVDVRRLAPDFDAGAFVRFCATEGRVDFDGTPYTLLAAPMSGFYSAPNAAARTQLRLAWVEPRDSMDRVPELFATLFEAFESSTAP